MKPFDDHFVAEYEFPSKPDGTLQPIDLTCQECNRFFRHWIEHKFGRLVSKPATAICSDCMKGHPYDLRELREKVGALYYWIEKNKMREEYLKTMIHMTEQMLQWKKDE